MHTLKPIDKKAILDAARETGGILTIEEHSHIGGLGGAVAEIIAEEAFKDGGWEGTEVRDQRSDIRRARDGGLEGKDRGQKSEVRSQKGKSKRQRSADYPREMAGGFHPDGIREKDRFHWAGGAGVD